MQTLFSEIVFGLDTHQITGFALKGWAEQLIQDRAAHDRAVSCLEGFENGRLLTADEAIERFLELLYEGRKLGRKTWEKRERNAEIYRRHMIGEGTVVLAKALGLSDRRARSIIEHECKHEDC